jgi:hypothetical protein
MQNGITVFAFELNNEGWKIKWVLILKSI